MSAPSRSPCYSRPSPQPQTLPFPSSPPTSPTLMSWILSWGSSSHCSMASGKFHVTRVFASLCSLQHRFNGHCSLLQPPIFVSSAQHLGPLWDHVVRTICGLIANWNDVGKHKCVLSYTHPALSTGTFPVSHIAKLFQNTAL